VKVVTGTPGRTNFLQAPADVALQVATIAVVRFFAVEHIFSVVDAEQRAHRQIVVSTALLVR